MAIRIARGSSDKVIDQIIAALRAYQTDHPKARIDVYRQNSVSVRVRIVDASFAKLGRSERHELVWRYLEPLSDELHSEVSMLVLLAPGEVKKSFSNVEFDDPVPSTL